MKNMNKRNLENHNISPYFIPRVIFSSNFLKQLLFLHVLHLDILGRQTEYETESENFLVYGYNAGTPMAIPIYTVLLCCVMIW